MANINLSGTIHSELQSKVITERIATLEKYLGDLCINLGRVSRKNARVRDTGDTIVATILAYIAKEKINTSSIQGLRNYAQYLSSVEDYRNTLVERIENKVIQPLSKYDEFLKTCKSTIKSTISVRDKEKQKQQKLNTLLQRTPDNGRNIAQAEATVESAMQKVSDQDRILAEKIDKLEEKKLNDIKNYLKEYTHINMIFHAKALEMLSEGYQCLLDIDTDNDLEEFRNTFTSSNLNALNGSKQSLNSNYDTHHTLNATGGSLPVTPSRTRAGDMHSRLPRRAKSNDNLTNNKKSDYSPNSTGSTQRGGSHSTNKQHSARHGNKLEIEDYTSDSDEE